MTALSYVFQSLRLLVPLFFVGVLLWGWRRSHRSLAQVFAVTVDRRVPVELGVGLAIGGIVMLGIFAAGWALGTIQQVGFQAPTALWWRWVGFLIFAAVFEELLARSFLLGGLLCLLRNANWTAIAISALYFGLAHLANPNATIVSVVGNSLGGVMYAVAFLGAGRIWMACGLHFAWNFFQGMVFGFPVSGITVPSLIQHPAIGPEWITGGAYGPEAGLLGISSRFVVIALLFGWFKREKPGKSWGDLLHFK